MLNPCAAFYSVCIVTPTFSELDFPVSTSMPSNVGFVPWGRWGGGTALPYMGYVGMCRCEGYGFQAVYSVMGYINQRV